jgi:hypothetical protein
MDKPVWDDDFVYKGIQSVKVSCHPSDHGSRVACNLIGDQPLFYIDDASDIEDDDFLFQEETELFPSDEKFLAKMKTKLAAYEKTAETLSNIDYTAPEDDFDNIVLGAQTGQTSLNDIMAYGGQSGLFKSYADILKQSGVEIAMTTEVEASAYHRESQTIHVNPFLDVKTSSCALMKSMRVAWNHINGALINPLAFQPEEAVLMNRLMAADVDVAVVAFMWDMKLAGDEEIWANAMMSSHYDLCAAYAMEAMTDFRSIKSGLAARATFEKWFLSARCKSFDRQIIQTMMGSHTDVEIGDTDASRMIALDMIIALGARPLGANYLSSIAPGIMSDALYGEVRDRSNANFLWFITFERRMDKMEQELQDDVPKFQKDNVYELPNHSRSSSSEGKGDGEVASLFFLDHFRAG